MQKRSLQILIVGQAITFIWIGILILRAPAAWGGYLQPWAFNLLPLPIEQMMIGTAILDILIGIFLLIRRTAWIAALVGGLHIFIVLLTSGITDITVRDIGLLGVTLAVYLETKPKFTKKGKSS